MARADPSQRPNRPCVGQMEHRRHVSPDIGLGQLQFSDRADRVTVYIAVGQDNAFLAARGPARLIEVGRFIFGDCRIEKRFRR